MPKGISLRKPERKTQLEKPRRRWGITLKCIFKNWNGRRRLDSSGSEREQVAKSCEQVAKSCEQVAKSCEQVAKSCEQVAKSCEQVAKSCEQVAKSCEQVAKSCEHGNESSKCIKCVEFMTT